MARFRGYIQKRSNFEDTRRLTRRERLHQLCADAANASTSNHNWLLNPPLTVASGWHPNRNQFEPLTHLHDRRSRWFANRHSRRRRAREHKRKELVDFQLTTLDAELSTRFDHVIKTNEHGSNVQLPELDLSPMQVVKWQPSPLSPARIPTARLQPVSNADWSNLEINSSPPPPPKKASSASLLSPPISLMTAAELGLLTPSVPKVCLPQPTENPPAASATPSVAPIVTPWIPVPPVAAYFNQNPYLTLDAPGYDDIGSPFVAAKLPHFHDIDPFDLTIPSTFDVRPSKNEHSESQQESTRCVLHHHKTDDDVEECSLNSSQSLRVCEEGRMPGLVHDESATAATFALDTDWSDEPVVDWPYDALGHWNDEPALDWNGEPLADWTDEPIDGPLNDLVMIEHDAETYEWTFLSPKDRAQSNCISIVSSAFSSMEVLPLPLRDSFMEESSVYKEPVRKLAEDGSNMRIVSKSAWESESDFCIPAFFWEGDKTLSEEVFESAVFATYPQSREDDKSWDW